MSDVVIFPGQGSQSVGMLSNLRERIPSIDIRLRQASEVTGLDLLGIVDQGPEAVLNQTEVTQPSILAVSIGLWDAWSAQQHAAPAAVAGHSLGEYSALVAAGVLDFVEAVSLVQSRGQYMQQAVAGQETAMAAILGLEDEAVRQVCEQVQREALGSCVEAVNFNSPGQVVIAGQADAVAKAIEALKAAGARRAVALPVSVPSHCSLMRSAAEQLGQRIAEIPFKIPRYPVVQNVTADVENDPVRIRDNLVRQLYSPVLWTQSIALLASRGVTRYFECGPGKVLCGLVRKIDRGCDAVALCDAEGWGGGA